MADIFLSYAEEDREPARKLVSLLEGAGWSVWWDRRIPAGKTWRAVLDAALDEMRCMVVLWSKRSIASDWVIEEAEEGRSRAKLLPILIDAVLPPRGFRQIQALDFSQWDQTANASCVNLLIGDIESFIGKPSRSVEPAAAAFAPPPVSTHAFVSSDPQRESDKQPVEAVPSRPAPIDPTGSRAPDQNHSRANAASAASPWASNRLMGIVAALIVIGAITAAAFVERTDLSKLQREGEPASASVAPAESAPAVEMNVPVTTPALKQKLEDESAESSKAPVKRLPTTANAKKVDALEKVERRSAPGRCSELLSRAQLGEPLQAEEQTFLRNECR